MSADLCRHNVDLRARCAACDEEYKSRAFFAVDPGVTKGHGIAYFEDGSLVRAFHGSIDDARVDHEHRASFMLVELPIAPGGRSLKGDTNDLICLAFEAGRLCEWGSARGMRCVTRRPSDWKGSAPKEVTFARTWKTLHPRERAALEIPLPAKTKLAQGKPIGDSYAGDVLDAIGLGLWHLGRMNTRAR